MFVFYLDQLVHYLKIRSIYSTPIEDFPAPFEQVIINNSTTALVKSANLKTAKLKCWMLYSSYNAFAAVDGLYKLFNEWVEKH